MSGKYPKEQRDRAVRMVLDRLGEYSSLYATCMPTGTKIRVGAESLRGGCLRPRSIQVNVVSQQDELAEIGSLNGKVRDLVEANEILKQASTFFAREFAPRRR